MKEILGSCGCGQVTYKAAGEIAGVVSCHCTLCQKLHGNYNPMVVINKEDFSWTNDAGLGWFGSSTEARRGFCTNCGAALCKEQLHGSKILISVGSLHGTSNWKNTKNVFTEEAGEYYLMPPQE